MLKLSQDQFSVLEGTIQDRFEERLVDLIRELRPDAANRATPEATQRFLRATTAEARILGFQTEFEIAVFCAAMLLQGRAVCADPSHPLHPVVTRPGVEPRLRAVQLLYELDRPSQVQATPVAS